MRTLLYFCLASFVTVVGAFAAAYAPGISPAYRMSLGFLAVWIVPCMFIVMMAEREQNT